MTAAGIESPWTCPDCGRDNLPDAAFCGSCGSTRVPRTTCAACGQGTTADARFCDACGNSLAPMTEGLSWPTRPITPAHTSISGRFDAGTVLDELPHRDFVGIAGTAFSTYRANLWRYWIMATPLLIGVILDIGHLVRLAEYYSSDVADSILDLLLRGGTAEVWLFNLTLQFALLLIFVLVSGATAHATAYQMLGGTGGIIRSYKQGLVLLTDPIVIAAILLLMGVPAVGFGVLGLFSTFSVSIWTGVLTSIFTFSVLVWPIYAEAKLVEGGASLTALRRSWELMKGDWGIVMPTSGVNCLLWLAVGWIPSIPWWITDVGLSFGSSSSYLLFAVLPLGLLEVALVSLILTRRTFLYYELRTRNEGYTLDQLASDLDR